jgi:integrase
MELHSDNGQETNYTQDLKKSIRTIVRFALTGTRAMPIEGELPLLRCVKSRTPKDKLSREDLPTNEDVQKLLDVCADSPRDKALIAVQNEAGTRINELLTLQIKHVKVDEYGAIISVDGKTGARKIRIVSSVPYLTKWINTHPYREDPESPLWVYLGKATYFGNPMSYAGFNNILRKRIKQAKITKRIHSHLFRHREITELAGKLTEAESRIRHGWTKSSPMPARYTHLNQEDLDEKMLQIKGVKKQDEPEKESLRECVWCKIKHPIDMKYCEVCSRPLDVTEVTRMEEEQEERTKALIMKLLREEHSNKSKGLAQEKLEKRNQEQQNEINQLRKLLEKATN